MKKVITSMVFGMTMFAGIGAMYVANTGCHNSHACDELVQKVCKNADKDKKAALMCNMWKKKVEDGLTNAVCEENLKNLK